MGGKHGWARKHIPLYIAGLILLAASACASTDALVTSSASSDAVVTRRESVPYLQRVQLLMSQGNFEVALKESQETLVLSPASPPGDEALYYTGLIYVHDGNPKKDHHKAHGFFARVIKEFPQSPRAEEAKVWIGVLKAIEKAKQVDIQIEEKKNELTR